MTCDSCVLVWLPRYLDLERDKADVLNELQDANIKMDNYERGHGLAEAVAYQKKLLADIKLRDQDIVKLNNDISDALANQDSLEETNRRLKLKCGLPEDFKYEDLEINEAVLGQVCVCVCVSVSACTCIYGISMCVCVCLCL